VKKLFFIVVVFVICLLGTHSIVTAGFLDKIKSYFSRNTMSIDFPEVTGQYAVGTTSYHWVDNNRLEKYDPNPSAKRELMVQFWYPSVKNTQVNFAKYQSDALKKELIDAGFTLNNFRGLDKIRSNAILQVSIFPAKEKYPVVIFSHGFGMSRFLYSAICEELASRGYIVVGIDHPYAAELVRFPDGREVYQNAQNIEDKLINLNAAISDVSFVIDNLETINAQEESTFYNKLDLTRIGIFGHSFGGIVTTHICRTEPRVKAGINMAGPLFGENTTTPFNKPFMFLLGEEETKRLVPPFTAEQQEEFKTDKEMEDYRQAYIVKIQELFDALRSNKYKITIKKMDHNGFSDYTWLKELPLFKYHKIDFDTTSENGYKMTNIINDYIIWFFDKYLKGKDRKFPEYTETIVEG